MNKPFSQASENNKHAIAKVLARHFQNPGLVLEVGAGTGQHACFFAELFEHLTWQATDVQENLPGIQQWCEESSADNLLAPLELDVCADVWPVSEAHFVYSANTAHIMAWPVVEKFVRGIGKVLLKEGLFFLYGPFNYGGEYTSESNARFDQWLMQRNTESAIRDFEALVQLAQKNSLQLVEDNEMPANNRCLVFSKI